MPCTACRGRSDRRPAPANGVGGAEDDAGADGVWHSRGSERPGGAERCNGVLLDGEGMQAGADTIGRGLPGFDGRILRGEVRLPEGDVAHAADAVDQHLLRAFSLEGGDLLLDRWEDCPWWRNCAAPRARPARQAGRRTRWSWRSGKRPSQKPGTVLPSASAHSSMLKP